MVANSASPHLHLFHLAQRGEQLGLDASLTRTVTFVASQRQSQAIGDIQSTTNGQQSYEASTHWSIAWPRRIAITVLAQSLCDATENVEIPG